MVGVFAAPAPLVGKLVGFRVLPYLVPGHALKQGVCDSLNILYGVTGKEEGREGINPGL